MTDRDSPFMERPGRGARPLFALVMLLALPVLSAAQGVKKETVVFCVHDGVKLSLDIAYPAAGKGSYPALIYLPGNGWGFWGGPQFDRRQYAAAIAEAAARGYVAASVDTRPISLKEGDKPKYRYPAQLIDARSAVRWLRANAARYHVDPKRIGAIGWSSGGNLALMLGLVESELKLDERDNLGFSSRVQAVVSLCGHTELARKFREATGSLTPVRDYMGGSPDELPAVYREASPLYYVKKGAPPALLIYGDSDPGIPLSQASLFVERMKASGAEVKLIVKEHGGHSNAYADAAVFPFLDKVLKARP